MITVQELIARLEDLPPDTELHGRCEIIERVYQDVSYFDIDLGLYGEVVTDEGC